MPKTASILGQPCLLGFLISWSCSVALAVPTEPTGTDQHQGAAQMHHGNSHAVAAKAPTPIPDIESGRIKTGLPFKNPPMISSRHGVLEMRLNARARPVNISGKKVNARVFSASAYGKDYPYAFMPPTILLDPGDNLKVNLTNWLGEPTNLHTHGFFISPTGNQDNIFVDLTSSKSFLYNYFLPKDISPGSYWYHPHYHPLVEEQVFGGLSGFIYIRGLEAFLPADLRGVTQQFLGLKDFQVDRTNSILSQNINSDSPTNRTINGLVQPAMTMRPGETQLWHLGNLSADIWYDLEIPGLTFNVIGVDGNPVDQVQEASTLLMPPGKRFDVLVQTKNVATYQLITREMNTGPEGDTYPRTLMATLNVKGTAVSPVALPKQMKPLEDLANATVTRRRIFELSENDTTGQFFINEKEFNANQVDATPVTGTVEEWVFRNRSQELHPIHVHVNDAQVISVNGIPQQVNSWLDTIPIPYAIQNDAGVSVPGEVVMRFKFRDFIGPYVFHCHILAHEDNGMMTVINVTSPDSEK
jgi:suppressor of ftsI